MDLFLMLHYKTDLNFSVTIYNKINKEVYSNIISKKMFTHVFIIQITFKIRKYAFYLEYVLTCSETCSYFKLIKHLKSELLPIGLSPRVYVKTFI